MRLAERDNATFHFSTRGLAPARRLPLLRDIFGEAIGVDFHPQPDQHVTAEMIVRATPGLRRTCVVSSLSVTMERPAWKLADGDDSICLIVKTGGRLALEQRGQEAEAEDGDGLLLLYREPARLQFQDMTYDAVRVPFAALAALARNVEATRALCIRRNSEALRLLRSYMASLPPQIADQQLGRLSATHVYDLLALAIGATGEYRHLATHRGLKAARLHKVKADLTAEPRLSLEEVAARQSITPRYVQMLFEEADTTFSAFVLDRRLDLARGMLTSPRFAQRSIVSIALDAGFGDLSYFNRCFKRRYNKTPSDLRAHATRGDATR